MFWRLAGGSVGMLLIPHPSLLVRSLDLGVISALLQEICSVYPMLTPPTLTGHSSNRVCNALALLQCVASHPETRGFFLAGTSLSGTSTSINQSAKLFINSCLCVYTTIAHIPLLLYPFLNTTNKTRPFEYLRLTSLGVIGALVKVILGILWGDLYSYTSLVLVVVE